MKIKSHYFILAIILVVSVTACGGNKKEKVSNSSVKADITRPPVFVKTGEKKQETDPNETISAEEWLKKRTLDQ